MASSTDVIQQMVERLVECFDPDEIILFGSRARGTASPESDVDLLVIASFQGSKRAKQSGRPDCQASSQPGAQTPA